MKPSKPVRSGQWRTLGLAAILMVAIAGLGTSWACVPQPLLSVQPRASGPSGAEVTVEGVEINGKAEIRWNSVTGPQLGTTSAGPSFTLAITIPPAEPGLYALVLVTRSPDGGVAGVGRAAFLVTSPNSSALTGPTNAGSPGSAPRDAPAAGGTSAATKAGFALGGAGLVAFGWLLTKALRQNNRRPDHPSRRQ